MAWPIHSVLNFFIISPIFTKLNVNIVPLECFVVQCAAVSRNNMTDAQILEVRVTLVAVTCSHISSSYLWSH